MDTLPPEAADQQFHCSFYNTLSEYEHHFDDMEFEVRKIASYWLGVIFAALAFVMRGGLHADASLTSSPSSLCLIALFGNVGLFALWALDQRVYHSLLNAAFSIGLQLERRYPQIPPVRSQMWANSEDSGMGRFQLLFYVLPMAVIALGGLFGAARATPDARPELLTIALVAAAIPLWIGQPWLKAVRAFVRWRRGGIRPMVERELADRRLSLETRAVLDRWETTIPNVAAPSLGIREAHHAKAENRGRNCVSEPETH